MVQKRLIQTFSKGAHTGYVWPKAKKKLDLSFGLKNGVPCGRTKEYLQKKFN
jgi:hypothetical protein